jgi:hypothetical protein
MARKRRIDPLALMYAMTNVMNTIDSMSQRREQLNRGESGNALKMIQAQGGQYPEGVIKGALQGVRAMPPDPNFIQKLFGKESPSVDPYLSMVDGTKTTQGIQVRSVNEKETKRALEQKQRESDIGLQKDKDLKTFEWLMKLTEPKNLHFATAQGNEGTMVRGYHPTSGEPVSENVIPVTKTKTAKQTSEEVRQKVLEAMEKGDTEFPMDSKTAKQVLGKELFRSANSVGVISQFQSGIYNWASAQKEPAPIYGFPTTDQGVQKGNLRTGELVPTGQGKPIGEETQQAMAFIGQIKDSFKTFQSAVKEYGWHGPIVGAYGETAGRVLPTWKGYEQIRPLAANLKDIVYPKSGKQINETELATLNKYVPLMTDKEETVKAKMDNFERHLSSIEENYKTPKTREPQPKGGQQPPPSDTPDEVIWDKNLKDFVPLKKKK